MVLFNNFFNTIFKLSGLLLVVEAYITNCSFQASFPFLSIKFVGC